jgi:hypothetical protein
MGEIALTFANPPIRGAFEIAGIEFIEDNDGGRKLPGKNSSSFGLRQANAPHIRHFFTAT